MRYVRKRNVLLASLVTILGLHVFQLIKYLTRFARYYSLPFKILHSYKIQNARFARTFRFRFINSLCFARFARTFDMYLLSSHLQVARYARTLSDIR